MLHTMVRLPSPQVPIRSGASGWRIAANVMYIAGRKSRPIPGTPFCRSSVSAHRARLKEGVLPQVNTTLHFKSIIGGTGGGRILRWIAATAAVLLAGLGLASSPTSGTGASPNAAPAQTGVPQVVVAMQMMSQDLVVTDVKFRGFYNKIENKFIPLTDFDFAANASD